MGRKHVVSYAASAEKAGLDLRYPRAPSWKPEAWKQKIFDAFAARWLHYFGGLDLPGTDGIVLYEAFGDWCEETYESTPLLGRNGFYDQIERKYGPLGATRYHSHGATKFHSLRLRTVQKLPAEQTPLPMSDPRDEATAEASGQEKKRNPGIF